VSDAAPDPATDPGDPGDPGHPGALGSHEGTGEGAGEGEVEEPVFPPKPLLRLGYDRAAVDQFVATVVLAVHNERQTSVSADDVARQRFPSRRLGRGYRMREVDDYLGAAEALLRMRAAARGVAPDPEPQAEPAHPRDHHPTWWIYGVAVLIAVAIVVFTLLQT